MWLYSDSDSTVMPVYCEGCGAKIQGTRIYADGHLYCPQCVAVYQ
jgi:hypothetical protein